MYTHTHTHSDIESVYFIYLILMQRILGKKALRFSLSFLFFLISHCDTLWPIPGNVSCAE